MHQAVIDWLGQLKQGHPDHFKDKRVLECGARNINGSPRPLFEGCDYTGLDAAPGQGVDVVSLVHQYKPPKGRRYDVVVSTEMLEHDPFWRESLQAMAGLLRAGGALILTWAGPERAAHCREVAPQPGYYRNLSLAEVTEVLAAAGTLEIKEATALGSDRYLYACAKPGTGAKAPTAPPVELVAEG